MSKYIRTKDGRIAEIKDNMFVKLIKENDMRLVYKDSPYIAVLNGDDEILKQADTIGELCDEFVYVEYKKPRVLDRVITREIKEKGIKVAETIYCHPNWNGIIYGAIWTDKGLIYVAKMNNKGEIELI